MSKLRLQEIPVKGKKVLMRVDYNVPLSESAAVVDDTRIQASLASIHYVLEHGGALILMSHLGRPQGKPDPRYSLAPCAKRLSELLQKPVTLAPDCVGEDVVRLCQALKPQQILMLENVRFHAAEEDPEKDPSFAQQLALLGDVYVNDAFGTCHRSHSSTTFIAKHFPGKAAAGFLVQKELKFLGAALLHPKRPFYALIGGAKVSSKIGILQALLQKVDALLIGGGMAYTFLKAQGYAIGDSICEPELFDKARQILQEAQKLGITLHLPQDIVAAKAYSPDAPSVTVDVVQGVPPHYQGMDIGPKTIATFSAALKSAQTIFWNGPVGVAEFFRFAKGTQAMAHALSQSEAVTVVGGGDSIAALQATNCFHKISHVSTGGGASLEFIEYGSLPGIDALSESLDSQRN